MQRTSLPVKSLFKAFEGVKGCWLVVWIMIMILIGFWSSWHVNYGCDSIWKISYWNFWYFIKKQGEIVIFQAQHVSILNIFVGNQVNWWKLLYRLFMQILCKIWSILRYFSKNMNSICFKLRCWISVLSEAELQINHSCCRIHLRKKTDTLFQLSIIGAVDFRFCFILQ